MNDQANTQDLSSLESRLAAVRRDLVAAAATATKRRVVSLIVLLIIIIAMIIYLSIIFGMLKRDLTLDSLAMIAETKLDAIIDDQSQKLIADAKAYAPEAAEMLKERAMSAPAQLAQELRTRAKDELSKQIAVVEPQIIDALKELIDRAYNEAGAADGKPMTQEQFDDFLRTVAQLTVDETLAAINEARKLYLTGGDLGVGASNILDYLNLLASEPTKLDTRGQHHRKIVTQTLAVLEKYQQEKATGAQGAPATVTAAEMAAAAAAAAARAESEAPAKGGVTAAEMAAAAAAAAARAESEAPPKE